MPSKQRRQRHALNQRAYQNGFEAGADEATKRFERVIALRDQRIATLEADNRNLEVEIEKRDKAMRSQRLQCVFELATAIKGLL